MTRLILKPGRWIIMVGFLLIIMGIIFQLQSISFIGPSSSSMYANQDWTYYGLIIMGVGISVLVIGLYVKTKNDRNPSIS